MVERQRTGTLNIRVNDDEERMLKAVAQHQGLSVSDVIRQYIRRAFADAFPPTTKKKRP
jgi:uncharacterized protein (DUF1778 family)